jgi:cobalamin synthase
VNPLVKIALSALLVYAISELARRNQFAGSALASIPLVSVLAMIWLWVDTRDVEKVAQFSKDVFWLVIPSLVLFVLLPVLLLKARMGFYAALATAMAATAGAYFLMIWLGRFLGGPR